MPHPRNPQVPRTLRRVANTEKSFTLNFFEREVKRVAYEQQREERRREEAETKEAAARGGDGGAPEAPAAEWWTDDDKLEESFLKIEEQFKVDMGIADDARDGEANGTS